MQKMRLISEAYAEIVENDPQTAVTKHAFRNLVNSGRIPSVQIGRKKLVAMEDVMRFFYGENQREDEDQYEKVRVINDERGE